jgi:hypothetical protein
MKTNWTIQSEPNRYDSLSEEDVKKLVNLIQDDIDRDMLDRYEWDWEFRNLVDKIAKERKNES